MSRKKNSLINIKYAMYGQVAGLLLNFVMRIVFVKILSAEYLGVEGLFTNILDMLSLAELGVGTSIIYSLYKPIAENDKEAIKTLMKLYKKMYVLIGMIIGIVGICITPFLNYFIKSMPNIQHLKLIYIMFIINSAISYFYSYKRSLIIAHEKRYITTIYRYGFYIAMCIAQILALFITRNYILFLSLLIINTVLENICVAHKADRMYPYLKDKDVKKLPKETRTTIVRNIRAMMYHRIGSIVVGGTDNLLISKFVGVIVVGMYSNYLVIIQGLNLLIGNIFIGITSSIGNLGVTESEERLREAFDNVNFIGFCAFGFSSICLLNLFNPFIYLWLGKDYLFSWKLMLLIVINFYLTGMRKSVLTFRDALGLYWYDRYKAVFEAAINLIVSLILIKAFSTAGVFLGTMISTITTCFWVEPFILYKYGLRCSCKSYFTKYISYTLVTIFTAYLTTIACNSITGYTVILFFVRLLICITITGVIFIIAFYRTKEFKYWIQTMKYIERSKLIFSK